MSRRCQLRPVDPREAAIELWQRGLAARLSAASISPRALDWWRERWRDRSWYRRDIVVAECVTQHSWSASSPSIPRTGYLDQIVVAPEAWGAAWPRQLLAEAPSASRRAGLDLHVNKDNARAIRLLREARLRRSPARTSTARSGAPVYMMTLAAVTPLRRQRRQFWNCSFASRA